MEQHFYCSVNTKWMNAVSKDDVVEVNVNNIYLRGIPRELTVNNLKVELLDSRKVLETDYRNIRICEKKIKTLQNIPIEVNDLVSCIIMDEEVQAIIEDISAGVRLVICSGKNCGKKYMVSPDKISFMAKGYTNSLITDASLASQMDNGMALLYPAPCIIMAVPPDSDPAVYPNEMAVKFPWSGNDQHTVLPVVRMGPGTMVVVVPSSVPGLMTVQGPVQVPVQAIG